MKYAKITNNIVEQVQPYSEEGFIEVPNSVVCGMAYDGTNFSAPVVPLADRLPAIRSERDGRLKACDWTVLPDSPLTQAQKDAYLVYRQELRDFPALITEQNVDNPPWPVEPVV